MSSDDENDNRTPCKYGFSCYQKNPAHHAKYKHPEKRNRSISPKPENDSIKKQKLDPKEKKDFAKQHNVDTEEEQHDFAKQQNVATEEEHEIDTKELNTSQDSKAIDDDSCNDLSKMETKETTKEFKSLKTMEDKKDFIKQKFLVDMPEDFYLFWDFCELLCKQKPKEALKDVGLILVGPYDILDNSFQNCVENDDKYLLHWRYYYDPPEFQTIIKGNNSSGYHIGYFRDSPSEKPAFVGSNEANKNCTINEMGENIFAAINTYLENLSKTADPFKKISINKLHKSLLTKAKELQINLNTSTASMQSRRRKSVCKTFHTAGIVVPYNRKTEIGYRPLPVNEKELRKILSKVSIAFPDKGDKAFSYLQPVLTAATIANDECDFGTGLELGINLFCNGNECFNGTALNVLKVTYALLQRREFAQIAEVHLNNRKKGIPYDINSKNK